MSSTSGNRFVRLFVSQLGYKVISFCATALLTRALTPSARGIGFFFEMYFLAAGFLAREAVRSLHARVPLDTPLAQKAVRGSGLICALFALIALVPLCMLHAALSADTSLLEAVRFDSFLPPLFSYLPISLILAVALVADLAAESHFNLIIGSGNSAEHDDDDDDVDDEQTTSRAAVVPPLSSGGEGIESRARTESISLLFKTGIGAAVVYGSRYLRIIQDNDSDERALLSIAALAFALGHFAYGTTTWIMSCIELGKWVQRRNRRARHASLACIIPDRMYCTPIFSSSASENIHAALTFYASASSSSASTATSAVPADAMEHSAGGGDSNRALMSQFLQENVLRLLLTEGEKFVLSSSAAVALSAQGAFDVATSIGALAARLLFRLWEEFAFNEWARVAAGMLAKESFREPAKRREALPLLEQGVTLLHNMCRVAIVVGVMCCAFGPLLSGRVLWLLYGSRWANKEASDILAVFVCVLPLFGLNGLVEAFGRAMCSAQQLQRSRTRLLFVSGLYLVSALAALKWSGGDVRFLILANAGQFVLRIAIGLSAAKQVVDHKRTVLNNVEVLSAAADSSSSSSSWAAFLAPMLPSRVFLAAATFVAAAAWMKAPPTFDAAGRYTSPFMQRDGVLFGCALGVLLVAVRMEPDARQLIRGLLSRKKE